MVNQYTYIPLMSKETLIKLYHIDGLTQWEIAKLNFIARYFVIVDAWKDGVKGEIYHINMAIDFYNYYKYEKPNRLKAIYYKLHEIREEINDFFKSIPPEVSIVLTMAALVLMGLAYELIKALA